MKPPIILHYEGQSNSYRSLDNFWRLEQDPNNKSENLGWVLFYDNQEIDYDDHRYKVADRHGLILVGFTSKTRHLQFTNSIKRQSELVSSGV